MRLALIVDAYSPTRTSAAVQMRDLAKELVAQGHSPTVIVPSAELRVPCDLQRLDEIEVLRVRAFRTKDIGYLRRFFAELLLPYLMLNGLKKGPLTDVRWDGIVWYSPTIFFGPAVSALKRKYQCRAYLILRDLFPDWAVDAGVMNRGPAYWILKVVEGFQYSVADVIGVQTHGNLRHLRRWGQSPARRVEVLSNWLSGVDESRQGAQIGLGRLNGKFVFVYVGNMGPAQGMDCLLELADRMRDQADVGFLFVGRGVDVPRLRSKAMEMALENVLFYDEIDPSEIPDLLAQCHVGLVALDPRHKTHNVPGKFLAYLRAGLPVLARINAGNDLEELIDANGVGRVCVGESPDALYELAAGLITDSLGRKQMGARGKALARRMFSVSSAAMQIAAGLRA